jgi:D-alanine-D-alanine ligase
MRVVVLAGGLCSERNVSIVSGTKVYNALKEKGHQVVLLDVFMGYEEDACNIDELFESNYSFVKDMTVSEIVPDLKAVKASRKDKSPSFLGANVAEICKSADITFLALHGGVGENGQLQACFDILGIKYTGANYLGSAVAMHKGLTKGVLNQSKIGTPKGEIFTSADKTNGNLEKWSYFPCVVKPCNGGSSVGVSIVESKDEFFKAMDEAFAWENEVVVEQYVSGREFSIGVIEGKALPIIEIIPESGFYDYVNKYQAGKTKDVCPAELDEETTKLLQKEAERAFKALGLDSYARIDFLLDSDNNTYCLEANSLPGMTPTSLLPQEANVIGLSYGDLCEKIIEVSLKKYQ